MGRRATPHASVEVSRGRVSTMGRAGLYNEDSTWVISPKMSIFNSSKNGFEQKKALSDYDKQY